MGQSTSLPPGAAYLLNGELIAWAGGLIVLWILNVALTGWLAGRKGRNDDVWAVRAIFFGPVALIAILVRPPKVGPPDTDLDLTAAAPARVRLRASRSSSWTWPGGWRGSAASCQCESMVDRASASRGRRSGAGPTTIR